MEGFESVQNFFCNMHCSRCQNLLKADGITILREEHNFYVVKIVCIECNQPVGLAIVGIAPKEETDLFKDIPATEEELEVSSDAPQITYDDVIDAHHFFSNLGSDWTKHLEDRKNNINIEELEQQD